MVANINRQIRNLGFTVVKYGMPIRSINLDIPSVDNYVVLLDAMPIRSINLDIPSDLTIIAKKQIS